MRRLKRKRKKKLKIFNVKQAKQSIKKNWWGIVLSLGGIALLVLLGFSLNSFLFASDYFNVTEIEVIDQEPDNLSYPLARIKDNPNIFKIDLEKIAYNIERDYSDIQKAIVNRVLPNKLVIEILRRRPVAQIALIEDSLKNHDFDFFTVNKDGYILADIGRRAKRNLPVIYGVNIKAENVEIGRSYTHTNLIYAISFMEELKKTKFQDQYRISKIDVSQPRSMSFFIGDKLEVKIGDRNWKEKIENLGGILENMDIDYSQEYYVDLRFKDLVFGKK